MASPAPVSAQRRPWNLLPLLAGGALLVGMPQASHALLIYSAEGGGIHGTLGSTAFTGASWSLSASADETTARRSMFTVPMVGPFDLWWLPVNPKVRIQSMATVLEADLLPSSTLQWLVLSGTFPKGPTPKLGFVFTSTPSFSPETAAGIFGVPGSFIDLQQPFAASGDSIFEVGSYPTSVGTLQIIDPSTVVTGSFRITPSPLPALGVAAGFRWSCRLRRRIHQGQPLSSG